jgi:hypothetical protein
MIVLSIGDPRYHLGPQIKLEEVSGKRVGD